MATLQESQPREPAASEDTIPSYTVHIEEPPRASDCSPWSFSNATSIWSLAGALDRMDYGMKLRAGLLAYLCTVLLFTCLWVPGSGPDAPQNTTTMSRILTVVIASSFTYVVSDLHKEVGTLPVTPGMGIYYLISGLIFAGALHQCGAAGLGVWTLVPVIVAMAALTAIRHYRPLLCNALEAVSPLYTFSYGVSALMVLHYALGMLEAYLVATFVLVAIHYLIWGLAVLEKEQSERHAHSAVVMLTYLAAATASSIGMCIGAYSNLKADTP